MTDSLTLTASVIANLAFTEFLKASSGEAAKQLTAATLSGLSDLRQQIWSRLRGVPAAETAKATVEAQAALTPDQLEQLVPALAAAMQADPTFAGQISQLANGLSQQPGVSTLLWQNIQAVSGGTATQVNDPTAPVFTGTISGGTININYHSPTHPPSHQPTPSPSATAAQRLALFKKLASLPGPQFEQILFALNPPPGNLPSAQAPQGDRVKALLDWVTSIGPGLDIIEDVYTQIIYPG